MSEFNDGHPPERQVSDDSRIEASRITDNDLKINDRS